MDESVENVPYVGLLQQALGETPVQMTWVDFLQEHPPGVFVVVSGAYRDTGDINILETPDLQLYCSSDSCNNLMFFECASGGEKPVVRPTLSNYIFLHYICRNCHRSVKTFSLWIIPEATPARADVFKFGEEPPFGPPVPTRVIRLIQPDRELFLRGRRCENQGLGIGAFTYYRRVVENQWARLVDEVIKVATSINAPKESLAKLNEARNEQQFSKAVRGLKDAIPLALLIKGHNPLTLLHTALSQGVHNLSDEACLDLAKNIRIVLFELADRIGQALKDKKEIDDAVARLLQLGTQFKLNKGNSGCKADQEDAS